MKDISRTFFALNQLTRNLILVILFFLQMQKISESVLANLIFFQHPISGTQSSADNITHFSFQHLQRFLVLVYLNYSYATRCLIDLKPNCIFKFVRCLDVFKKNYQFRPWRNPGGPLIGKGPPISTSQGQF